MKHTKEKSPKHTSPIMQQFKKQLHEHWLSQMVFQQLPKVEVK